jgi:hypothetical protein
VARKKGAAANLARIALNAGRRQSKSETEVVDIITFIESDWGLGMKLFPVQRVILKAHYGIALDDNPDNTFVVTDWKRENHVEHTEASYLRFLYEEGRCNIKEVIPGQERRNLILPIGRRSGKTMISACIAAYETYKLINKGNPQNYYGVAPSNPIRLVSVATGKEQAGLLYEEVSHHFAKRPMTSKSSAPTPRTPRLVPQSRCSSRPVTPRACVVRATSSSSSTR